MDEQNGTVLADPGVSQPVADWRVPFFTTERAVKAATETIWQRSLAWFFLSSGALFLFFVARKYAHPEANLVAQIEALALMAASQLTLIFLCSRLSDRFDVGPGLKRLGAKVPSEDACPVSIEVKQFGVVTGYDEGYMWIEDGTLFFKGLQTVFRLNAEDVPPLGAWPNKARPNPLKGRDISCVPFLTGGVSAEVRFRIIDPFEDYHARRRSAKFLRELTLWASNRPSGSLESLLPPLSVHPALTTNRPLRHEGLVTGLLIAALNLVVLTTLKVDLSMRSLASVETLIVAFGGSALTLAALQLARRSWSTVVVRDKLERRWGPAVAEPVAGPPRLVR
ncbi:MAG: hypothetical protein KF884_04845 [Fimbriimonadaceae bacterium]|nr:hypothetical protein [Fimbriimonadaceae bacterium]QYK59416.1 MAG: hypothetical protein KF884_04845 [Fimbriimonadaceae bacterium]